MSDSRIFMLIYSSRVPALMHNKLGELFPEEPQGIPCSNWISSSLSLKLISPTFHFQGWTLWFLLQFRPTMTVDTSILTSSPGQLISLNVPFVYRTSSSPNLAISTDWQGKIRYDRAPLHHTWSMQLTKGTDTGTCINPHHMYIAIGCKNPAPRSPTRKSTSYKDRHKNNTR